LRRGAWVKVGGVAECGGAGGASQLTYACADCELGPNAALSFTFHYSCQSLLLEAAAVPASYPPGEASLLAADAGATSAGGGLLTALTWSAPPLLTQCRDQVTAGGAASRRGYAFTLSTAAPQRAALPVDGAGNLLLSPAAAALNLTVSLPLSPTFVTTSLTPLVPWTQLLANIVGLSGVVGVVGLLFGLTEKRLAKGKAGVLRAGAGAGAGAGGGDASAAIEALQRQLDAQHAEQLRAHAAAQQQLHALAEQVRLGSARSEGGPLTVNPLHAEKGRATGPRQWRRVKDAEDVWFVAEDTGETVWAIPEGGVEVQTN
jgi:hypothetical protein